jgi:DNA-binding CsgD family transcriptional regulator
VACESRREKDGKEETEVSQKADIFRSYGLVEKAQSGHAKGEICSCTALEGRRDQVHSGEIMALGSTLAIERKRAGRTVEPKYSRNAYRRLMRASQMPPRLQEIHDLIVRGLSYKEIGSKMGITEGTAKTYSNAVFTCAGVHSREELIFKAMKTRLGNWMVRHGKLLPFDALIDLAGIIDPTATERWLA